jgi:hypothetical protein
MIKQLFTTLTIMSCAFSFAQETVSQPDLKAAYEIPKNWKVQEHYKGDWDKPSGSAVCQCALAINIFKIPSGMDFDYIHMVLYPSNQKGASDTKRGQVWQYKINVTDKGDSVHTANLQWIKYQGRLTCSGENRFKDCTALKYQTHKGDNYYTVYFWGTPELLTQYKDSIDKIISSFKAL